MKSIDRTLVISVLGLTLSSMAGAATVECPVGGSPTFSKGDGTRVFYLTTTTASTCLLSGEGNIKGSGGDDFTDAFPTYTFLDKDEATDFNAGSLENLFSVTGLGALNGSFTLDASVWNMFSSIALGFKTGTNLTPDWAVFGLASGTLTGSWEVKPQQGGGLSHLNFYGIRKPTTEVPEPGGLALLGLGLVALAAARKRTKRA